MTPAHDPDADFYRQALRRIHLFLYGLAAAGTLAVFLWRDWRWALGYLIGAAASSLSFRFLHKIADALTPGGKPPTRAAAVFLGLRFVIYGAGGYLAATALRIDALAILLGLGVTVAAVLLEIGYQLVRFRAG